MTQIELLAYVVAPSLVFLTGVAIYVWTGREAGKHPAE